MAEEWMNVCLSVCVFERVRWCPVDMSTPLLETGANPLGFQTPARPLNERSGGGKKKRSIIQDHTESNFCLYLFLSVPFDYMYTVHTHRDQLWGHVSCVPSVNNTYGDRFIEWHCKTLVDIRTKTPSGLPTTLRNTSKHHRLQASAMLLMWIS